MAAATVDHDRGDSDRETADPRPPHAWMDEGFNTFIDTFESDDFNKGEYGPKRDTEFAPGGGNPVDEILPILADPAAPPILSRADTVIEKWRHPNMTTMRSPAFRRYSAPPPLERPTIRGRWIVVALILTLLADAILLAAFHIRIERTGALAGFAAWTTMGAILAIRLRAPRTRWQRALRDLNEGISLFALASLLGAIASYPLAASHHALADTALERSDAAFHFHWVGCYRFVAAHPWLQMPERAAYLSIFVTPAILVGYFTLADRADEIRRFLATFWIAMILTLALFPLFPAIGPLATLWHGALPYMPVSGLYQDELMLALREHRISSIDLGALHGLVCAPSFHAASAAIYIATACRARRLRWPLAGLNLAMLAATPVEGTHYLTDLLAGIAVAGVALLATHMLTGAETLTGSDRTPAATSASIVAQ